MKLQKLSIEMKAWGEFEGKYLGEIKFVGKTGDIALVLKPEHVDRIFAVVAESLVDVAKDAANNLMTEAFASQTALAADNAKPVEQIAA